MGEFDKLRSESKRSIDTELCTVLWRELVTAEKR